MCGELHKWTHLLIRGAVPEILAGRAVFVSSVCHVNVSVSRQCLTSTSVVCARRELLLAHFGWLEAATGRDVTLKSCWTTGVCLVSVFRQCVTGVNCFSLTLGARGRHRKGRNPEILLDERCLSRQCLTSTSVCHVSVSRRRQCVPGVNCFSLTLRAGGRHMKGRNPCCAEPMC